MFSSGPNYTKLKTNLRLALNRLKLNEKKKTELAQKARKEIADYLATGKIERAKIRVEHIIREDYLVEALEIVEMYCDTLLARYGLITQMKDLDSGIAEAVSSIIWVAPRLQNDIQELKIIADILIQKYGNQYAESVRTTTGDHHVSEKLIHKLAIQAPPKLLVEKYLVEIAKNYNIAYEPDPQILHSDEQTNIGLDGLLIDLSDKNNLGGKQPPTMGFIGYPQPPPLPVMPELPGNRPFNYPYGGSAGGGGMGAGGTAPVMNFNIPPNFGQSGQTEGKDLNITNFIRNQQDATTKSQSVESPDDNIKKTTNMKPTPQPRTNLSSSSGTAANITQLTNLPNVPSDIPDNKIDDNKDDDEIDFNDLSRRFEQLKKFK